MGRLGDPSLPFIFDGRCRNDGAESLFRWWWLEVLGPLAVDGFIVDGNFLEKLIQLGGREFIAGERFVF